MHFLEKHFQFEYFISKEKGKKIYFKYVLSLYIDDHSRVILKTLSVDDYINANYIEVSS